MAQLQELNGLTGGALVPGINLALPGPPLTLVSHTVGAQESLYALASRYGTTADAIADANGLPNTAPLPVGRVLFVPQPVSGKRHIVANGYLIPDGTAADAQVLQTSSPLSYVTVFSYRATATGSLVPLPATQALAEARALRLQPLLSVTNFDGQNFNTDLAHTILSSAQVRARLTSNIAQTLSQQGFAGVNIDFEHMRPEDRPLYNSFIESLPPALHPGGHFVSIAMGPKTKDEPQASWMGAFDYAALGRAADFIMLMTYEWGWVGGPPMAVAPLDQVRAVLEYAASVIPAEKLLMGIPTYGYDWKIPHEEGVLASGIAPQDAQNLAIRKETPVRFDPASASPTFHYTEGGQEHEVWYEDAKSLLAKFHLVYEMGLRGMSFWVLGQSFPQLWSLLADTFDVE
jgi:spore germination protein